MTLRYFTILLFALFFGFGCSVKKELLNEIDQNTDSYRTSMLCGQIQDIQVMDKRNGVNPDILEIPVISWPGMVDEVRPPLTPQLEMLILNEISYRSLGSGHVYSLDIHILEGLQRFEATWTSEEEYVNWKIELFLQSPEGTASAVSDIEYFAKSIDASLGYIDELYVKTLRLSVLSAFSKAIEQLPNSNCSSSI